MIIDVQFYWTHPSGYAAEVVDTFPGSKCFRTYWAATGYHILTGGMGSGFVSDLFPTTIDNVSYYAAFLNDNWPAGAYTDGILYNDPNSPFFYSDVWVQDGYENSYVYHQIATLPFQITVNTPPVVDPLATSLDNVEYVVALLLD